jgi:hypothetical protein
MREKTKKETETCKSHQGASDLRAGRLGNPVRRPRGVTTIEGWLRRMTRGRGHPPVQVTIGLSSIAKLEI